MIKHICFDFDGVILDSLHIHLKTLKEVFDLDYRKEDFVCFLDGNFFDSEIANLDWDKYHKSIGPKYESTSLKTEIIQSLKLLSKEYSLSINSSVGDEILQKICNSNNVSDLFSEVWGSQVIRYKTEKFEKPLRIHSIQKDEMVFVTDTLGDIREANETVIPTIAITGGYHDRDRLEQGTTVAIVDSWSELIKVINKLD